MLSSRQNSLQQQPEKLKYKLKLHRHSCQTHIRESTSESGSATSPGSGLEPVAWHGFTPTKGNLSEDTDTWVDNFRELHKRNKYLSKVWFWDNFNWNQQSIWIGRFNKFNNLPDNDSDISEFLKKLIDDLNRYEDLQSYIYLKFYYSRNTKTNEPEINYLLICNEPSLPADFSKSLVSVMFDRYQLSEGLISKDRDFKRMINHYLNWSNFYTYYNLMGELQF